MSQVSYGGSSCNANSLSSYNSSSSYFFLGNEWNFPDTFCSSELGIVDPDPIELFEGLNELPRSIYNDIKKIESDSCPSSIAGGDLSDEYFEHDLKPEIRNIDCMWSGHSAATSPPQQQHQQPSPLITAATTTASTTTAIKQSNSNNNNNKSNSSIIDPDQDIDTKYIIGDLKVPTALPLSMITGKTTATEITHHNKLSQSATTKDFKNKQLQQKHQPQSSLTSSSSSAFPYYDLSATIKVEPEDYEDDASASNCSIKSNKKNQIMQNIPPGTSLLRRKISTATTAGATTTSSTTVTKTFIKKEPQQQQQSQFTHHHLPKSKTQKIIYNSGGGGGGVSNKNSTAISTATIPIPNVTASDFIRDREMRVAGVSAGVCSPSLSSTSSAGSANIVKVGNRSVSSMSGIDATCTSTITTNNGLGIIDGGGGIFNSSTSGSVVFGRPDTPLSLDDDPTEFKHSVDLRACVMGSNNISLISGGEAIDNDPAIIIRDLREQLEDTSKKQIDIRRILPLNDDDGESRTLADVIAVINDDEHSCANSRLPSSPMSLLQSPQTNYRTWDTSDDDDDEEGEEEDDEDDDDDGVIEDDDGIGSIGDSSFGLEKFVSPISQNSHSSPHYPIMHSDHSYTRSKDGVDDIGPNLETPSDSDEEIDVVSIGDKKLPTNPSAKDRRVIQTKVAYKFSSSRIVKTPNGIRTILPRRRGSYELPYTPASISPVKSGSPLTSSRYPSPASTPYNNNNGSSQYSGAPCGTTTNKKLTSSKFIGQYNNRVGGGIRSISSSSLSSSSSSSSPTSIIPSTIASSTAATVTKGPLSIASRKRFSIQAGGASGSIHHNHHHHHHHRRTIVGGGGGGIGTRIVDDGDDYVPPSKRYRSKRQKQTPQPHLQHYQQQQQQQQKQQQQQRNTTIQYRHTLSATAAQNDKSLNSKQQQQQQHHHHHLNNHQHQQYHRHNGGGGSVSGSGNDDTADTIEKRNLHNDMERQRRIGLKNLFEGLKAQIPSIKDKERAPKVNILREAAKLCENLVREDQRLIEQKTMLKEQLIKRQELLHRLRSSMQIMNN